MNSSFVNIALYVTLIISSFSIHIGFGQGANSDTETRELSSIPQKKVDGYADLNVTHFSLKYPIGWNVYYSSPSREFESYTIEHPVNGSIEISITPFDVSAAQTSGLSEKSIQENNDSDLPQIFPWVIDTIQSGFENGVPSEPEEISYDKYAVDGH